MKTSTSIKMSWQIAFVIISGLNGLAGAFVPTSCFSSGSSCRNYYLSADIKLSAVVKNNLSTLPKDISPFEKSSSKRRDVQGEFRKTALSSLEQALKDGKTQLEMEFPPLLGGDQSKSQFDDFDNVQELNKNRDWCIELLPNLSNAIKSKPIWFILPDLKEVELAKEEWGGQRYRQAGVFSSIEAVASHYSEESYAKPWGATFASGMSQWLGGSDGDAGLLGDQGALDSLDDEGNNPAAIHLVCQPGNGGVSSSINSTMKPFRG
jgi:hypothetical protein